ncbi:MAG: FkbM family methyltransferase [Candidatus Omnitrophica bacterium]|nr:FkbM family methyltransferase [Candidatus Omnitrophota bacterium]
MNIVALVKKLPRFFRRHKLLQLLLVLFPQEHIQLVRFNGDAYLFGDLLDADVRSYFMWESFEPEFFVIARPFLEKGGVFFDAGANFGFCSFGLMSLLPHGNVEYHLFEANPYLCTMLKRSAGLYASQQSFINNVCLSDTKGVSKLFFTHHRYAQAYVAERGKVTVLNLKLDDYIQEHHIARIDFLKLDIEGMEVAALKGLRISLNQGIIKVILMEISRTTFPREGVTIEDGLRLLYEAGFRLFYVKEIDFKRPDVAKRAIFLDVGGAKLRVAEVSADEKIEGGVYQSDILAIHSSSELLS